MADRLWTQSDSLDEVPRDEGEDGRDQQGDQEQGWGSDSDPFSSDPFSSNDPASLGPRKGRRILFGLIANRERADALTAARNVPQAGAAAWNSAITRDLDRAAILTLDAIEAGPEMMERREAITELGKICSSELRREEQAIRDAEDRADTCHAISQEVERGPSLGR